MHENVIILNLKDNCKALQAENEKLREALEAWIEANEGAPNKYQWAKEALKNEKATNFTTDD